MLKGQATIFCKEGNFHTFGGREISLNIFIHSHLQIMQVQLRTVYHHPPPPPPLLRQYGLSDFFVRD